MTGLLLCKCLMSDRDISKKNHKKRICPERYLVLFAFVRTYSYFNSRIPLSTFNRLLSLIYA